MAIFKNSHFLNKVPGWRSHDRFRQRLIRTESWVILRVRGNLGKSPVVRPGSPILFERHDEDSESPSLHGLLPSRPTLWGAGLPPCPSNRAAPRVTGGEGPRLDGGKQGRINQTWLLFGCSWRLRIYLYAYIYIHIACISIYSTYAYHLPFMCLYISIYLNTYGGKLH